MARRQVLTGRMIGAITIATCIAWAVFLAWVFVRR